MRPDTRGLIFRRPDEERPGRATAKVAVLVAALTFSVWAGFGGTYHFDDDAAATCDPASQGLGGWAGRLTRTLRPATKVTYALEATAGLDAPGRRAVSAALQAAGAVAMLLLLLRLARAQGDGPFVLPAAATVVLLWAIHPVHAESVLAIAGRSAVLSSTLLLWALVAHSSDRRVLGAVLYLLAGLARETALLAIVVIAVAELGLVRRTLVEHGRRLLPYGLTALVLAGWFAMVPRYRELADYSLHGRPWLSSVVRQVAAVPLGLSLYGRPWALTLDHGEALPDSPAAAGFALGLALYAAAIAGAVLCLRRRPAVSLGLAMWLTAILPTQSVVPKLDALTERPLALALGGLLVVGWGLRPRRLPALRLTTAAAAALAVTLGAFTLARGALYRSDVLLWSDAAAKSVTNPRPHLNLAVALMIAGDPAHAARALEPARALDPLDPRVEALTLRLSEPAEEEARR